MYGLTLAALTVLLPIGLVKSLDCLTGRTGFGLIYTKCNPGINYCAKGTAVDPVYGHVIDKGCDTENFCDAIGSRCLYNSFNDMEMCCCASNLCNGSISYLFYLPLYLIATFVFIVLNL